LYCIINLASEINSLSVILRLIVRFYYSWFQHGGYRCGRKHQHFRCDKRYALCNAGKINSLLSCINGPDGLQQRCGCSALFCLNSAL